MKNNKELFEELQNNIAISNFEKEKYPFNEKINLRRHIMKKKVIAISTMCFILVSGVAFAMNFEKIKASFGLGKAVDKAVEDGYIAEPEMDYIGADTETIDETNGIVIEDLNVEAKVSDFLMDDLNLSTHFDFKFDTKINEVIDFDKYIKMELKDLIVTDENENILFCMDKTAFEEYCQENKLDYKYGEENEKVYNCGLNNFVEGHYNQNRNVLLTYNIYTGDERFPKSKKLSFKFGQIYMREENAENTIIVKGNWQIDVDVPEKMYNRQSISYKVVNNENPNLQVTNATLYDTGFELGIIAYNTPKPEMPKELVEVEQRELSKKKYDEGLISEEEYNETLSKYKDISEIRLDYYMNKMRPIKTRDNFQQKENIENITYIENENGQKFTAGYSASRKQNANFIDGDKFNFYETFELTPSDATDTLKVKVMYYDKPYIIELERVK